MPRILVVDDNHDILQVMELLLKTKGYEVETTLKGDEVTPRINSFFPDLILMDVYLGGWDGREICQNLKTDDNTRQIPVILFSAFQQAEESAHKAGANDFIGKPFDIEDLLGKIRGLISSNVKCNVA